MAPKDVKKAGGSKAMPGKKDDKMKSGGMDKKSSSKSSDRKSK